ncbi:MAG: SDR family NAD(P)-dependent oxidoreductase, partial [Gemmatimonadetes bacterium]|nr:SDR family NAD(P)-dependent oxidoreductase [Gemmatimonadota bacterium]
VAAAAEEVRAAVGDEGLAGLVNNAGVVVAAPLEFVPLDEVRHQLEVNLLGPLALVQALLPTLRRARGRIVNIGSVAGKSALPFMGPYAMSKFALEALTDALRVELMPWDVRVAVVEPGAVATSIWRASIKAADELAQRLPPQARELYGKAMAVVRQRALSGEQHGIPAERVARAVEHALTADAPRTRYLLGWDSKLRLLLERLPDRLRDRVIAKALYEG